MFKKKPPAIPDIPCHACKCLVRVADLKQVRRDDYPNEFFGPLVEHYCHACFPGYDRVTRSFVPGLEAHYWVTREVEVDSNGFDIGERD